MPLPWMLGAMVATTLGAVAEIPIEGPTRLRLLVVPVIGVLLGSGFTTEMLSNLGNWIATIVILPAFIVAAFAGAFTFYRFVGGYDRVTAYYAAAPGGLNDMMLMGAAAGGDEKRIALAHASRILVVVTFVVLFYGFVLGVTTNGDARPYTRLDDLGLADASILIACAVIGAWAGPKLGLPAGQILGPLILSGAAHMTGLTHVPPPTLIVNAAQWVMGTTIGCRFRGTPAREILRDILLAAGASTTMLCAALVAAFAISLITGTPVEAAFLAFSPGGLPEMSILALSLDIDAAYVATSHIARIALIIAVTPIVFRMLGIRR